MRNWSLWMINQSAIVVLCFILIAPSISAGVPSDARTQDRTEAENPTFDQACQENAKPRKTFCLTVQRSEYIGRASDPGSLFLYTAIFGHRGKPEWDELAVGNALCRNGEYRPAVEHWEGMLKKYPKTDAEIATLENIAACHLHFGNTDSAIAAYERILTKAPPRTWQCISGHMACATLSDLWLQRGDKEKALKYAELATTVHACSTTCGTFNLSANMGMADRASLLRFAIAVNMPVRLQTGP